MRSTYLAALACALAPAMLAPLVAVSTVAQAPAAAAGQAYRETIANTVVTFDLVHVPGGTITVGGTSVDVKPFYIGKTEVTWDQYRRLRARPRSAQGRRRRCDCPAVPAILCA